MSKVTYRHYRPNASWFSFRRALCSKPRSLAPTPIDDLCPLAGPPYSTAIRLANSRSLLFGLDAAGPYLPDSYHVVSLESIAFIQRAGAIPRELKIRTVPRSAPADFQKRNRSPLFFPTLSQRTTARLPAL